MALKYYFEFNDVKNVGHRAEIYNDDYTGEPVEIVGRLSLSKAETEDTLEAIRGTGLSLELEANTLLSFDDIYTSDERLYSVKYLRDSELIYYGWISPSDIFESYVNDVWNISLDCIDGLGYLENLSYVDNATGLPFTEKQTGLEIIVNCLKRTGLNQKINTSINVRYDGLSGSLDTLNETYFNANRFIKDDGATFMDCEEVMRSILEIFAASITQRNGEWFIYKSNTFVGSTSKNFFSYDSDGVYIEAISIDLPETIGSQLNGYYPHYVNANQQVSTNKPVGAYTVNYKYGVVKSLFDNIYLESQGTLPSLTIDEWTIDDYTYLDFPVDNLGLDLEPLAFANPRATPLILMTSDSFSFLEGNVVDFKAVFNKSGVPASYKRIIYVYFKVVLVGVSSTYYLEKDGTWTTTDTLIESSASQNLFTLIVASLEMPVDGDLHLEVFTPVEQNNQGSPSNIFIKECSFYPVNEDLEDVEGELHSFQVITNPSSFVQPIKEVYNGDSASDVYVGTMYESDESTPTELWSRDENPTRLVPLLQIMGEERMKMYAKPLRVFSGDIFGYIEYMSVVSLDGFDGVEFMCIEYNYDAYNNVTELKLKQILNDDIGDSDFSGLDYSLNFDYGNVVNPTITG
ncbi:hypothetical protein N9928_01150 [bacterium]|nr:hypothetical protein [bacterium]